MIDFIDKTSEQNGTPINRENLMALQGFQNNDINIIENEDGSIAITETNGDNHTLTTLIVENEDGSTTITQMFVGEKNITKTVVVNEEGTQISEVIE